LASVYELPVEFVCGYIIILQWR